MSLVCRASKARAVALAVALLHPWSLVWAFLLRPWLFDICGLSVVAPADSGVGGELLGFDGVG